VEFKDCGACPTMMVIPGGRINMGSPADEEGRWSDEGPQHQVLISRAIAVGKFEITYSEWDVCVSAGACTAQINSTEGVAHDEGWGREQRPVVNLSWAEAKKYLAWLSSKTGKDYRFLSEAEWEYAARAGTTTSYLWGEGVSHENANYGRDRPSAGWASGRDQWIETAPVGGFAPNAFGVYDMYGNVWEWVEDCWNDSYDDAPVNGSAWTSGDCSSHVLRGGAWHAKPSVLRAALRVGYHPDIRFNAIGFRVARDLD
jgi:formylglycine-generating enzyme required for sulfatase activity